jgi:hypothetical protein
MVGQRRQPVSFDVFLPHRTSRVDQENAPTISAHDNFYRKAKENPVYNEEWQPDDQQQEQSKQQR